MLDNFLLHFDPAKIHKLGRRQPQRFPIGPVGNAALFFGFLARFATPLSLP